MAERAGSSGLRVRSEALPTRDAGALQGDPDDSVGTQAPCLGATEIFYGAYPDLRDEPQDERRKREAQAKEICRTCPIRQQCLWWALDNKEEFGVWGGVANRERERFVKWLKQEGYAKTPEYEGLDEALEEFRVYEDKKKRERKQAKELAKKAARAIPRKRQPLPRTISRKSRNGTRLELDRKSVV